MAERITCESKTPPAGLGPVEFDNSEATFTHDVYIQSDMDVSNKITCCSLSANNTFTTDGEFTSLITESISAASYINLPEIEYFVEGMIIMWGGDVNNIPDGWALCDGDGSPARPDLRGRFVVGYSGEGDYDTIGKTGGLSSVQLTSGQMPQHSHGITGSVDEVGEHTHGGGSFKYADAQVGRRSGGGGIIGLGGDGNNTQIVSNTGGGGSHSHGVDNLTIENNGSNESHENRPLYYTLAYLIYVGV